MKNKLVYIGIFLPIFFFALMLFTYAVNVPWFDDVEVFPDFLGKFLASKTSEERILLIFKPNNEHRVVYAKLINLLHYALTGTLNMRTLTIFSNITLLGILWLFWRVIKEQKLAMMYFLPIPFFLLQPQYYLTSLWTITGLQHQPAIFFGLLGMYLLSKNSNWTLLGAILVVIFNSFTMSNGLFYWLVGIVILALQGRYKVLLLWITSMVVIFKIYFYKFDNGANSQGFDYFFKHPHESFFGFFTYLGGSLDFQVQAPILIRSILPTFTGFVLVGITVWWLLLNTFSIKEKFSIPNFWAKLQQKFNHNPSNCIILGCLMFLVINAFIIAILRPRFGYFVMLVGNYKIYPALFLSIVYLMILTGWLRFQTNKSYFKWILVGSIVFNVASYLRFLPEVHERRKDLLVRSFNQEYNQIGLGAYVNSEFDQYIQTAMGKLVEKNIYQYPKTVFTDSRNEIISENADNQIVKVDTVRFGTEIVVFNPSISTSFGFNNGVYLLLKSEKKNYLIYEKRNAFNLFKKGFSIAIPPNYVIPNTYKIGIFVVNNSERKVLNTNQSVVINY